MDEDNTTKPSAVTRTTTPKPAATKAATPAAKAPPKAPPRRGVEVEPPPHAARRGFAVVILLLAAILAGYAGGYYGSKANTDKTANQSLAAQKQIVDTESNLFNQLAKEVGQSVVSVNITAQTTTQNMFFGVPQTQQLEGAGSGIIIDANGLIMTNRHVVPVGTTSVEVVLSDGTKYDDVEVLGRTAEGNSLDVAFIKIKDLKGKTLKPATLGDSSKVQVGDRVLAIGNALGQFQNTVTQGIISGFGRSIEVSDDNGSSESLSDLLQTDASINQGNSGGPLINMNGEVIGMNTAAGGQGSENLGFALPLADLDGLIKSVKETGKLQQPYLGVRYVMLTDDYAYEYNLDTKRGAYLAPSRQGSPVVSGSPADKAGLQEKDIIVKVDDTTVDENHSLPSLLGRHAVGDKVTLTVERDGKQITKEVTLEEAPAQPSASSSQSQSQQP